MVNQKSINLLISLTARDIKCCYGEGSGVAIAWPMGLLQRGRWYCCSVADGVVQRGRWCCCSVGDGPRRGQKARRAAM